MSSNSENKREYRQNGFVYLLDDEKKTAIVRRGHIGRCRHYRLPDHVMVGDERYTVEGMEALSFNKPRTLRRIVVPDTKNQNTRGQFKKM